MMMCCASCGRAEIDDIKLKKCNGGCDLVKYCRDECQRKHRDQHEEECKKRRAELRDRDLFEQPEGSYLGDCPICFLPLSLDPKKSINMSCCCKTICKGCDYANAKREIEAGLEHRCAFCREECPETQEDADKYVTKRAKKNDPAAICRVGKKHYHEGDYDGAFEYFTKAAELGHADAHFNLSVAYWMGQGVEKDTKRAVYHSEEAAIAGHPKARHNLGWEEMENGRFERARKHFTIAANLGWHDSLKEIKELYAEGHASKEDYAGALRAYQAALDATKSVERKKAEGAYKSGELMITR
jgi:TPR repeat protein